MSPHERQQRLVSTHVLGGVSAGAYARVNKYRQINANASCVDASNLNLRLSRRSRIVIVTFFCNPKLPVIKNLVSVKN
jgi:hypothetical protein